MNESPIRMLTIAQASKLVEGISPYRIRTMCISGELPCIKAGKKYLICEQVLRDTLCNPRPVLVQTQNPEIGVLRKVSER